MGCIKPNRLLKSGLHLSSRTTSLFQLTDYSRQIRKDLRTYAKLYCKLHKLPVYMM